MDIAKRFPVARAEADMVFLMHENEDAMASCSH